MEEIDKTVLKIVHDSDYNIYQYFQLKKKFYIE